MNNKLFKRIAATTLSLALAVPVVSVTLAACGDKEETKIETPEVTLTSIVLDTSAVKTQFAYGEEFSYEGLKVTAVMSDGTEQAVSLSECTVSTPVMTLPGTRRVNVSYKGQRANYDIVVAERVMPEISSTPLFEAKGENPETAYRVEAESIDLEISGVKSNGGDLVVEDGSASGGKYVANYGAAGNYFGFTFTAENEYTDVTLVLHVANATTSALGVGANMNIYLNYGGVTETGALDISSLTALSPAEQDEEGNLSLVWTDRVVRGVTIPAGTNTLTFDVLGGEVACIDYVEFYVGAKYGSSVVTELSGEGLVTKEFEDFDLEKIVVRPDIKSHYNLPDGVAFIETPSNNNENTSGGKSVGAVNPGSEISTMIRTGADATVSISLTAACTSSYKIKDHFEFYIDGKLVEGVEDKDIVAGDAGRGEYWEWQDTTIGCFDLAEGDHLFVIKVIGGANSGNFDCFKFNVLSYGEYTEHPEPSTPVIPDNPDNPDNPDEPDDYDVRVKENGVYKVEAEKLDMTGNTLQEGCSSFIEYTSMASNGSCLAAFGVAGNKAEISIYLEQSATVKFAAYMAKYESDYSLSGNAYFTIDGGEKIYPDTTFGRAEDGSNDWYNWKEVVIASLDLDAGVHTLTLTVEATCPNTDYFEITVSGMEESAPECDITITQNGSYVQEAETLDKSGVVTRQDFIDAGILAAGEYAVAANDSASAKSAIYGFGKGTEFNVTLYAEKDCAVDIALSLYSDQTQTFGQNFLFKLDGETLVQTNPEETMTPNLIWKKVTVATGVELTAGEHTFTMEVLESHFDFDCITFKTTEYDGVAAPEETEPEINYDITIAGEAGEYTVEAEELDLSNIIKDAGNYTEEWAQGKHSLRGIQQDSVLTISIDVEEDVTVDFSAIMSKYEAYDVKDMFTVTVDGNAIEVPSLVLGRAEDGSNDWFNWKTVDFGELELSAGSHTIVLNFISAGPNIDCFNFTVAAVNA